MKLLKKIIPDKVKVAIKSIFKKPPTSGWFGNYSSWNAAMKDCTGYDQMSILKIIRASVLKVKNGEAVYERDSVLFDEIYLFEPLVNALKNSVKDGKLHVLDFGGSLGSGYFQHRHLFAHLKDLKWSVVEQKHYVELGKKEIAEKELNFYYTIEEVLKERSNQVLLLSSVLPYIEKPYELIEKLVAFNFDHIIIDRTGFVGSKQEMITKQVVPEEIYKASYPCWLFNEEKLKNAFGDKYDIVDEFIDEMPLPFDLKGLKVYWKGFYLKRKK